MTENAQDEITSVVNEVKKIMLLPDETPVLATVSDLEKVKGQEFFAKAQLGDKVLIFMNAKKAILYRPSDKLIVEVGRVNNLQPNGQVAGDNITVSGASPTPIPETTIFIPKVTPSATPKPSPAPKATSTPSPSPRPTLTPNPNFSSEY